MKAANEKLTPSSISPINNNTDPSLLPIKNGIYPYSYSSSSSYSYPTCVMLENERMTGFASLLNATPKLGSPALTATSNKSLTRSHNGIVMKEGRNKLTGSTGFVPKPRTLGVPIPVTPLKPSTMQNSTIPDALLTNSKQPTSSTGVPDINIDDIPSHLPDIPLHDWNVFPRSLFIIYILLSVSYIYYHLYHIYTTICMIYKYHQHVMKYRYLYPVQVKSEVTCLSIDEPSNRLLSGSILPIYYDIDICAQLFRKYWELFKCNKMNRGCRGAFVHTHIGIQEWWYNRIRGT